jgi:predicted helicase
MFSAKVGQPPAGFMKMTPEQVIEQTGGWQTGMREKFDMAMFQKDAQKIKELLPQVPTEYKQRFAADLKKMLPRIPYAQDFWAFSKAGQELAYWHLNYEIIEPYPLKEYQDLLYLSPEDYRVQKMTFGKRNKDKTTIVYNSHLTLSEIPLEAYDYIVNGKSALEWIIERYQFTKDKDSGITNDPNDWSDDPRYIIDLVKRIVRVSLETVKIVNALPALNERT